MGDKAVNTWATSLNPTLGAELENEFVSSLERKQRKAHDRASVLAFFGGWALLFLCLLVVFLWSELYQLYQQPEKALTGAFLLEVFKIVTAALTYTKALYQQLGELAWALNAAAYGHDYQQQGINITQGTVVLLSHGVHCWSCLLAVVVPAYSLLRAGFSCTAKLLAHTLLVVLAQFVPILAFLHLAPHLCFTPQHALLFASTCVCWSTAVGVRGVRVPLEGSSPRANSSRKGARDSSLPPYRRHIALFVRLLLGTGCMPQLPFYSPTPSSRRPSSGQSCMVESSGHSLLAKPPAAIPRSYSSSNRMLQQEHASSEDVRRLQVASSGAPAAHLSALHVPPQRQGGTHAANLQALPPDPTAPSIARGKGLKGNSACASVNSSHSFQPPPSAATVSAVQAIPTALQDATHVKAGKGKGKKGSQAASRAAEPPPPAAPQATLLHSSPATTAHRLASCLTGALPATELGPGALVRGASEASSCSPSPGAQTHGASKKEQLLADTGNAPNVPGSSQATSAVKHVQVQVAAAGIASPLSTMAKPLSAPQPAPAVSVPSVADKGSKSLAKGASLHPRAPVTATSVPSAPRAKAKSSKVSLQATSHLPSSSPAAPTPAQRHKHAAPAQQQTSTLALDAPSPKPTPKNAWLSSAAAMLSGSGGKVATKVANVLPTGQAAATPSPPNASGKAPAATRGNIISASQAVSVASVTPTPAASTPPRPLDSISSPVSLSRAPAASIPVIPPRAKGLPTQQPSAVNSAKPLSPASSVVSTAASVYEPDHAPDESPRKTDTISKVPMSPTARTRALSPHAPEFCPPSFLPSQPPTPQTLSSGTTTPSSPRLVAAHVVKASSPPGSPGQLPYAGHSYAYAFPSEIPGVVAHKHADGDLDIASVAANYSPVPNPAADALATHHHRQESSEFSFFSHPPAVTDGECGAGAGDTGSLSSLYHGSAATGFATVAGIFHGSEAFSTRGSPPLPLAPGFVPDPVWAMHAAPNPHTSFQSSRPYGLPPPAVGLPTSLQPSPFLAPPALYRSNAQQLATGWPAVMSGAGPVASPGTTEQRGAESNALSMPMQNDRSLAALGFLEGDGEDGAEGLGLGMAEVAAGPSHDGAEEGASCTICWSAPRQVGFLHGKTSHLCVCRRCALQLREGVHRCPMCRALIERIIDIY